MEIENAMRIWTRICDIPTPCIECPLHRKCNMRYVSTHIEEIVSILTKWAAEHPEKTIADDFLEKHPGAMKHPNGTPQACAQTVGYVKSCTVGSNCFKCWRRPLEE